MHTPKTASERLRQSVPSGRVGALLQQIARRLHGSGRMPVTGQPPWALDVRLPGWWNSYRGMLSLWVAPDGRFGSADASGPSFGVSIQGPAGMFGTVAERRARAQQLQAVRDGSTVRVTVSMPLRDVLRLRTLNAQADALSAFAEPAVTRLRG